MFLKYNNKVKNEPKGVYTMSNRELAKQLIDQIPDVNMLYVIHYLLGVSIPEEASNARTLETQAEI